MISKDMYELLIHIPSSPKNISVNDLKEITGMELVCLERMIREAARAGFIRRVNHDETSLEYYEDKHYLLCEEGRKEVKEYEDLEFNKNIATTTLEISRNSLKLSEANKKIAKYSMVASVASAVVAFFMLIATILIA